MTPGLSNRLDRDVYQVLKRLEETVNDGKPFKTSIQVYDAIKRSNSSLSRQKKRPLVDAIDRVLQVRRSELEDSEDSEAPLEEAKSPPADTGGFLLNRQLTKKWNVKPASMPSQTDERPAKRQRPQESGDEQDGRPSGNEAPTPTSKSRANGTITDDGGEDKILLDSAPVQKKVKKTNRFQVDHRPQQPPLGGVSEIQENLYQELHTILRRPDLWTAAPKALAQGMLITGPMGIGKRSLVRCLAARLEVPIVSLSQCFDEPERMEKNLTDAFDEAMRLAPSIILIENLDRHASKPNSTYHTEHHTRAENLLVRHMLRMDESSPIDRRVLTIATTSTLADISPHLLTCRLFESTVHMRVPDGSAREDIFRVIMEDIPKDDDIDYAQLAKLTHGFVGVDIEMAVRHALKRAAIRAASTDSISNDITAINDNTDEGDHAMLDSVLEATVPNALITMEDLHLVIKEFTPSLRKEGFTVIPSVSWDQVGALEKVREQMQMSVIGPIKHPDVYDAWGLNKPAGVLLWGPPGCGKTLVAQAVANEAQASFILINGPEILNKYVGESERAVREAFQRARSSTPCILFFDEIDSIAVSREGASTDSGSRIVATLLAELDGVNDRSGIYVIGTTNRPDKIDPAMLRPGRLSVRMFVDLPTEDERVDILRAIFRSNHPRASEAELARLEAAARDARCRDFSGADLQGLRIKAAEHGLRQWMLHRKTGQVEIEQENWEYALANTTRSVLNPESFRTLERDLGREA